MVKGINLFREYFRDFTDQYVLIGGAACDISFESNNVDFRATKDLDRGSLDQRIWSALLGVYSGR